MYKTKILEAKTPALLEKAMNSFYKKLVSDTGFIDYRVTDISYSNDYKTAAVTYITEKYSDENTSFECLEFDSEIDENLKNELF